MAANRVTMQTIADALGVSRMTVSRAFRGGLIARSRYAYGSWRAEELGYRPDPLQRTHMAQLRRKNSDSSGSTVAFLDLSKPAASIEHNPSGRRLVDGAKQRAQELGMQVEVFNPFVDGISFVRLRNIWRARGIHGVIIGPVPVGMQLSKFPLNDLAAVSISHSLRDPALHRVGHNHYSTLRSTLESLYSQGKRRFGLTFYRS